MPAGIDAETAAAGAAAVAQPPFLPLTALDRILQPNPPRDWTFAIALGIVLLLHVGTIVGAIELNDPLAMQQASKGQVDTDNAITVELVSAPDANAKKVEDTAELGDPTPKPPQPVDEPSPPQPAQPPQPQQDAVKPQQQAAQADKAVKAEKPKDGKDPAPEQPVTLEADAGQVASLDPKLAPDPSEAKEAKEAEAQKDAREANDAIPPNVRFQVRSAAPKGKMDAYTQLLTKALYKTQPQLWTNPVEVWLSFQVADSGEPIEIRIEKSSNDSYFDDVIMAWIKRARLPPPPPTATLQDRTMGIHYVLR